MGFIGIGAAQRSDLGEEALTRVCLEQLTRVFGKGAASPTTTLIKDWAADPWTSTVSDQVATGHPHFPDQGWVTGAWQPHLTLAGSEASPAEAGFLSGAVEASERAVREVLSRL
jgi:monoamine oxidase